MDAVRIAICDDEKQALDMIAKAVRAVFAAKQYRTVIETFDRADALLLRMQEPDVFHVILLDIKMPQIDGMLLAEKIRNKLQDVKIVFVSSEETRVFEAFQIKAFYFIRKSRLIADVKNFCNLYIKAEREDAEKTVVTFKQGVTDLAVYVSSILYAESEKHRQKIFLQGEKQPFYVNTGMDKLEEMLRPYGFLRIHKGYLVNDLHIKRITADTVVLATGETLYISRRKLKEVRQQHMQLAEKNTLLQ